MSFFDNVTDCDLESSFQESTIFNEQQLLEMLKTIKDKIRVDSPQYKFTDSIYKQYIKKSFISNKQQKVINDIYNEVRFNEQVIRDLSLLIKGDEVLTEKEADIIYSFFSYYEKK